MKHSSKLKTTDIVSIGISVALLIVCSWFTIPSTVPFTLQTFALFTTIALLGIKKSMLTLIVYMLLGIIGLPVFSGFGAGPAVLLGPTGGYLMGFIFTIPITGLLIKWFGRKPLPLVFSMVAGLFVCYAFGTLWFMFVYTGGNGSVGLLSALNMCVLPFIIPDLCKIGLAVLIQQRLYCLLK